jgi:hypothetical protein
MQTHKKNSFFSSLTHTNILSLTHLLISGFSSFFASFAMRNERRREESVLCVIHNMKWWKSTHSRKTKLENAFKCILFFWMKNSENEFHVILRFNVTHFKILFFFLHAKILFIVGELCVCVRVLNKRKSKSYFLVFNFLFPFLRFFFKKKENCFPNPLKCRAVNAAIVNKIFTSMC